MNKKEFNKNHSLALKGIAILMMMFHHCFRKTYLFNNYIISFFPLKQSIVVTISLGLKMCVSIFAFITGYGLYLSLKKLNSKYEWTNKEITKWTINRLIKMLSGFWIIAILSYIICQLINGRTKTIFFSNGLLSGIPQIIIDFFGLSNLFNTPIFCSSWWYMSIAILFVIFIPVFAKLFKKYSYFTILVAVIAIPRIIGWNYSASSFIAFLTPVLLGMICAEKNLLVKIANIRIINNKNKLIKFIIETIIIALVAALFAKLPDSKFYEIQLGLMPFLLIIYLYEFFIDIPILKQVFCYLGKHSMNIFLVHTFIRNYYLNDFIYSRGHFVTIAITLLLISLVISILIELFKKLIKYDKYIDKITNKTNYMIDKYIK